MYPSATKATYAYVYCCFLFTLLFASFFRLVIVIDCVQTIILILVVVVLFFFFFLFLELCLFYFCFICLFFFFGGGGREGWRGGRYLRKYWYVFFIVELIIELRMQKPWDNLLEDKNSKAFKLLSDLLENEVRLTKIHC